LRPFDHGSERVAKLIFIDRSDAASFFLSDEIG